MDDITLELDDLDGAIDAVMHLEPVRESPIKVTALTCDEANQLISRLRATTRKWAELLWRLREGLAWRALGYCSWHELCCARLGYTSRQANRVIATLRVDIPPVTNGVKTPESHVRELLRLPDAERLECYQDYLEECDDRGVKPTASGVRERVDRWLAPDDVYDVDSDEVQEESPEPDASESEANDETLPMSLAEPRDTFWADLEEMATSRVATDGAAIVAARLENIAEKIRKEA